MSRPSVNLHVSLNCPISVKFNEPNSRLPVALLIERRRVRLVLFEP
jgi:hypothetical protein